MIEIEKVEIAQPLRTGLNADLDLPRTGRIDGIAFRVAGWFRRPRGSANPKVRFHLAASADAEPVHWDLRELQSSERPGVPCHDWEVAVGFEGYVDGALLPRTFRVLISYRTESGEERLIGEVAGRRTFVAGECKPRFQPIAVYHGGRMGSTAMMRALLAHRDVAVGEQHPFENNMAWYLAGISSLLLRTAATGDDVKLSWKEARRFWNRYGANWSLSRDFQDYASIEATLASLMRPAADFARSSIDRCYNMIATRTGKTGARFLAEKQITPEVINALLWLYPRVKLILLTREPRDLFRSARDFNAKRGALAFGREFVDSDEEWIELKSRLLCSFVDVFDNHPAADRLHVPFEEFMTDTRGALGRVCEFLEVDRSPATIDAMEHAVLEETPESKFHRTRPSGQEIGSWRGDLSPAHARRVVRGTSAYMERFGYRLDPDQDQEQAAREGAPEQAAGSHVPKAAGARDMTDVVRQRDDMERASEEAVRAARHHEHRANEMGRKLNETAHYAEDLSRERDEAVRFSKSLETALKKVTEDAIAGHQAWERSQADTDTYVASLRAAIAERDQALQAARAEVESLKAALAGQGKASTET